MSVDSFGILISVKQRTNWLSDCWIDPLVGWGHKCESIWKNGSRRKCIGGHHSAHRWFSFVKKLETSVNFVQKGHNGAYNNIYLIVCRMYVYNARCTVKIWPQLPHPSLIPPAQLSICILTIIGIVILNCSKWVYYGVIYFYLQFLISFKT